MLDELQRAIANTEAHLESLRHEDGHWEGFLSSSALSTATAIVALNLVDSQKHAELVAKGQNWLCKHQNRDGGWGDTTISKSNLSTTLLCWSALHLGERTPSSAIERANVWICSHVGSLEPQAIAKAVITRYGKDKTFSVPILMLCALCGTLGTKPWKHVIALPFELAALPRTWFGAIGLPVVSYALPALIAIGHLRFHQQPPAWWNPLRWVRALAWKRVRPMLKTLQPSSGGYLEATPLTSFVTMALAGAGDSQHPCVPLAVDFLVKSMREDGAWPIDTNLATWGTTLSIRAGAKHDARALEWLLAQQYREIHPFTNAAPGGWAWTDLPGGVPDADDTSSALVALKKMGHPCDEHIHAGVKWLLDLQNRDGGIPTFCRGWGALPFDRSTPEITAHALLAWWTWMEEVPAALQKRITKATERALKYLGETMRVDGSWIPLWFGNEHTPDEDNPVYGTAQVMTHLLGEARLAVRGEWALRKGEAYLRSVHKPYEPWGGDLNAPASIEETALALTALYSYANFEYREAIKLAHEMGHGYHGAEQREEVSRRVKKLQASLEWFLAATHHGTHFPPAPIGLYFARLWYHERLYPVIWTLQALRAAKESLARAV